MAEGEGKRREGKEARMGGLKELLLTSPRAGSKFPVSNISPCLMTHGIRLLCEGKIGYTLEGMISQVRSGLHGRNGNVQDSDKGMFTSSPYNIPKKRVLWKLFSGLLVANFLRLTLKET